MNTARNRGSPTAVAEKYLVVTLGDETHGIPVTLVREIIRAQKVTPLPERSTRIEGVIYLRGRVIPIADLRLRFGLPLVFGETTCFVVVNLPTSRGGIAPLGLIVDSVVEVAQIPADAIEPAPDSIGSCDLCALLGLAKNEGRVMPLLDVRALYGGSHGVATETAGTLPDMRFETHTA